MKNNIKRKDNRRNFTNYSSNNAMPALKMLESYQNNSPELVSKLVEMAKKEQDHRHSWQNQYLESYQQSYRLGQYSGIIYNLLLLGLVIYLIFNGDKAFALKFFLVNAALVFLSITVTFIERRINTRKPSNKKLNNRRKNNHRPSNFETKN